MKRTTITLPEELAALISREAERRGTSVSEVIRTSVARDLRGEGRRVIPWAGICDDKILPRGAEIDEALMERWADDLDRDRR